MKVKKPDVNRSVRQNKYDSGLTNSIVHTELLNYKCHLNVSL